MMCSAVPRPWESLRTNWRKARSFPAGELFFDQLPKVVDQVRALPGERTRYSVIS
jgi:hypothetical protein